jgi:tRNA1Val (adenine37-N6)-methyltransferase
MFDGKLHCVQHKEGYRYSVDAVLLGHFISPRPNSRILDLGAGCGIISLILAFRCPQTRITSLEIQKPLVSLIKQNIGLNNFQKQVEVIEGDFCRINNILASGSFDWLVCNPPYRKSGSGRVNPVSEQAVARHEIKGKLADAVKATSYLLKNKGKAAFIYPASRSVVLISHLKREGLEPKRMQVVYGYPGALGKLIMVEAVKNGGEELEILPPFYIFKESGGEYSEEMTNCYEG